MTCRHCARTIEGKPRIVEHEGRDILFCSKLCAAAYIKPIVLRLFHERVEQEAQATFRRRLAMARWT